MLHNRFHTSIIQNMCFSHVGCCNYAEQLLCAKMLKCGLKLIPRDTCLKILKLDKFENVTFILSSPIAPSLPLQRAKTSLMSSHRPRLPYLSPPLRPSRPPLRLLPTCLIRLLSLILNPPLAL